MNGNTHKPHPCHYCWIVSYSKGALTRHLNQYHWEEMEKEEKLLEEMKLGQKLVTEQESSSDVPH